MAQKKLLLLGGLRYQVPVIALAKKLGYYVITCDNVPGNYAHRFSDEYRNVSIIDKDAVLELAKYLRVDGIMSFAVDPGVVTAAYAAEKLGLPHSGTYESVSILQNKDRFRLFLSENNFNVPGFKSFKTYQEALEGVKDFRWPLIVKPVDSAGSKGVTRVNDLAELKTAFETAFNCSPSRKVIIEEFIEKKGFSSDSDCFSLDGNLVFTSFSSQYFDPQAENPYTPSAYLWPASMSPDNQQALKNDIQRLLTLLDMRSSIYNIETRIGNDGKPYIMEVSPRGGGNRIAEMLNMVYGVDLIQCAIQAAMGEPVNLDLLSEKPANPIMEIVLHSNKNGVFQGLEIPDSLRDHIREIDLWVTPGDSVRSFKGANETIGTVVFSVRDFNCVQDFIDTIKIVVE